MKRIIRLFNTFLSWREESIEADQPTVPLAVNSDDIVGNIQESETKELMPDIYADDKSDTVPLLIVVDQPTPDDDESIGVNPYDTGVLQKKR
jgi:hypothetical protein